MQYGFDSAAVGALQAMPGFLKVFGYQDPSSPLGYGIDVRANSIPPSYGKIQSESVSDSDIEYRTATHNISIDSRSLHILPCRWFLQFISGPQVRSVGCLLA